MNNPKIMALKNDKNICIFSIKTKINLLYLRKYILNVETKLYFGEVEIANNFRTLKCVFNVNFNF